MEYLAFVNAVLGGFAFAFLGALITIEKNSRILTSTFIVISLSVGCFLVATLGSALLASAMEEMQTVTELPAYARSVIRRFSLCFIAGVFFFIAGIGMVGWIRSRFLGIATSIIAVFAGIGAWFMVAPFIN